MRILQPDAIVTDPLPLSVTPPGAPLAHFELRQVLADASTLFLRYERGRDDG